MGDWSAGYVADIDYTFGYYTELNPLRIKLAFLNNGLVYPECGNACELGFGQGLSTNIHAAASVTQWYGTDFSPAQASFAQELARIAGSNATLFDDSFADFVNRTDLPDFDYIGLHGIWSWVSDANRALIVEFIKRKLKVGGVVYVSYNTMPGWAAFAPLRHLMTEHVEVIGSEGQSIVSRIDEAIGFADSLLATNPIFSSANPHVGQRINNMKEQDRQYIAHEYFNRDWHPMHFSTMAQWLEPAKLQFACSCNYFDQVDAINLTQIQQQFLKGLPNAMFKESVRDFMVNQQFRRDYWVKGLRRLSIIEQTELLKSLKVVLVAPRKSISLEIKGSLGKADMNAQVYEPILDCLSDHKPKSIAQIKASVERHEIPFSQIVQAIMILAGAGHIATAQEEALWTKAKKHTDKLNAFLVHKARSSGEIHFLASPVTGGGVNVSRFNQLFVLAYSQGHKEPVQLANFVWSNLERLGEKIVKDGKALETKEGNMEQLIALATEFGSEQLPILRALQVI